MRGWLKKDLVGALSDLDQSIRLGPASYDVYVHRGDIRTKLGDFEGAIVDFNAALPNVGSSSWALWYRGRAKLGKKDYDGAIQDFTQEINKRPSG